jgi:hypothetical protein
VRIPPFFGVDFLEWLRLETEQAWAGAIARTVDEFEAAGVGGCDWQPGTRWTGALSADAIDAIERRFGAPFASDHRLFLETLHATAPLRRGARFMDDRSMQPIDRPGFYHWQRDHEALLDEIDGAFEGVMFDVEENALWLPSWGERPDAPEARRGRVRALVDAAPRLYPIFAHRFVVAGAPSLVLSIHQSDVIVYGRDLRVYLMNELADWLGLEADLDWGSQDPRKIPFWGELVG